MKPVLCVLGFWGLAAALFVIGQIPSVLDIIMIAALFFAFFLLSYFVYDAAKDYFNAK